MFIQHFDKLIDIVEIIGYMCFDVEITEKITKDILFKITLKDEQLSNIKTLIRVNSNFILFRFHQLKISSSSSINLKNFEHNNILTYTIKTLQNNLKTYNSISYQFGIRIDNENNWIDEDLANQTLTLIEKYKLSDFNHIKKILNQGTK
ncbi:hypothetical protein M9Y10_002498 [Tritrichomonas musculus]|uniref:Uncharacterized protein n=1 Tax=Tritrichomonas musculus TaxID=1915356 RepID=A0ABR2L9Y9_9EUKA